MIIAPDLDWEGIEREYRAGVLTLREIAVRFGICHSSIIARAKKYCWDRDLAAKIRAKAEALVTQRSVYKTKTKTASIAENAIIDANASYIADIQLRERDSLKRQRALSELLLAEVEMLTISPEQLKALGEIMSDPEAKRDAMADLYQKIISTPGRVDTFKKLVETTKTLIEMEWKVYGLDTKQTDVGEILSSMFEGVKNTPFRPQQI